MSKLTDIETIGEAYAAKLTEADVASIESLLEKGGSTAGRKQIADSTGISEKSILNWVNRTDLARIKGVSTQYADLLEAAGVDTLPELAQRSTANLGTKMALINTK